MTDHKPRNEEVSSKNNFVQQHTLLTLLLGYFCFYLINLTLLPIFGDESIYLDWGWTSTHLPGNAFISLLDAKQPLLIWIFSIFEDFSYDPLFAGRLVSVIIGGISLVGIYQLSKKLFGKKYAVISAILYALTPIVAFYNRQALMEAAVGCVGIWTGYATFNLLEKRISWRGIVLGVIWGIGFFIKTSTFIFIVASSTVLLWHMVIKKEKGLVMPYLTSLISMILIDSIILLNTIFWQTLASNSRYAYSPVSIFTQPMMLFTAWVTNVSGFVQIGLVFVTPMVFVASILGIVLIYKSNVKHKKSFLVYFVLSLSLEVLAGRIQEQRYLSPFIPFFTITAAYVFVRLWNGQIWKKVLIIISFLPLLYLTSLVIFAPRLYIEQLSHITSYAETSYLSGYTAGYGINETLQYINDHASQTQPNMVLFGLNVGNPESAMDLYANRSSILFPFHIDSSFFPGLNQYSCFTSQYPVFLVTRDGQMMGLDRFFTLAQTIPIDTKHAIRIYTLKKNCSGKSASLSAIYQQSINAEQQIKVGY
jgi:4-amino-4-deoxy-L-arabinose transferase-like glycosyltransferase